MFWSGKLIIESKSADKDSPKHWGETLRQAEEYVTDLQPQQRPQFILLMNFKRIQKHKIEQTKTGIKISYFCSSLLNELLQANPIKAP